MKNDLKVPITIESWEQAQRKLFDDGWNGEINRYRPNYAFRGHTEEYGTLPTSLNRLGGNEEDGWNQDHGARMEENLLRNFIKYAEDRTLSEKSIWHQLSVAQHYGLPTRILDWTYSPLVALHFATEDMGKLGQDGIVWRVDYSKAHQRLNSEWTDDMGGDLFSITELTDREITSYKHLKTKFDQGDVGGPVFFEPPSLDGRIVNQYGLFSVLPDASVRFDEWLIEHPELYERYRIPKGVKMEIRDKLDASNITERVLFPGLGGLADWLQRYYTEIDADKTNSPEKIYGDE